MNAKFSSAGGTDSIDITANDATPAVTYQPTSSPEHRIKRGTIEFSEIVVDPKVQRPQNRALINKIKAEFNEDALGTITISVRENVDTGVISEYVILDGQQRTTAANEVGWRGKFHAVFHYGLSLQDEAKLFRLLQVRVAVPVREQFRIALTERRPDATGIMQILQELNIKLDPNGGFVAVGVALRIAKQVDGLDNFRWALRFIQDVFRPDDLSPYDGRLVEALAQLKLRHGTALNTIRLREQIQKSGKRVDKLIGDSKTRRTIKKLTSVKALGDELIKVYNTSLQKKGPNWLPFWSEED
jgi:hypothetical protein